MRNSPVEVDISTACAESGAPIALHLDSDLNFSSVDGGSGILVFEPDVDWAEFTDPTILDGY